MVWDAETTLLLRQLWAAGHSTAEIGRRLGTSKNSIVGRAHRMNLEGRESPIRAAGSGVRPRVVPMLAFALPPPLASEIADEPPPVQRMAPVRRQAAVRAPRPAPEPPRIDATRTCEYLTGERRHMVACGKKAVLGKSYCPDCCDIVFVRWRERREEAA